MISKRTPIYVTFFLCLITIYTLFSIKENVMVLRTELQEINKQVQNEKDTIHLLKAELAYLTSPDRLQKLNKNHLELKHTKISQVISNPLHKSNTITEKFASAKLSNKHNKWRYKKGPSKYLTLTSAKK